MGCVFCGRKRISCLQGQKAQLRHFLTGDEEPRGPEEEETMNAIDWKRIEDGQARFTREVASAKGQWAYLTGSAEAKKARELGRDAQFHALSIRAILGEPVAKEPGDASAYETAFWDGYWAEVDAAQNEHDGI
jgi:hypothetical protein